MPQVPALQERPVCKLASHGVAEVKGGCKQTQDLQRGTKGVPNHTAQQPVVRV